MNIFSVSEFLQSTVFSPYFVGLLLLFFPIAFILYVFYKGGYR